MSMWIERLLFSTLLLTIMYMTIPDGSRNLVASSILPIVINVQFLAYVIFCFDVPYCKRIISTYKWVWITLGLWLLVTIAQTFELFGYVNYDKFSSVYELNIYISYVVVCFLAVCLLRNIERIRILMTVLVIVAIAQTVFGMANYYTDQLPFGWEPTYYASVRVTGTFINRNFYADLVLLCLGFSLVPLLTGRLRRSRKSNTSHSALNQFQLDHLTLQIMFFLVSGLLIAGLILSGSRGGVICLVFSISFIMILIVAQKHHGVRFFRLLFLLLSASLIFGYELVKSRFLRISSDLGTKVEQWQATLELIIDHWLLGYGPGSYEEVYKLNIPFNAGSLTHDHAHSDMLEIWLEQGLLGLMPLIFFVVMFLFIGIRKAIHTKSYNKCVILMSALFGTVSILLHGMFDFPFQVPANTCIFMILVSVVLSVSNDRFRVSAIRHTKKAA